MRATARRYILQRVLLLVRSLSLSLSLSMPLLKVSVHVTTRSREFLSGSFRAMPSGAGLHGFGAHGSPLVPPGAADGHMGVRLLLRALPRVLGRLDRG